MRSAAVEALSDPDRVRSSHARPPGLLEPPDSAPAPGGGADPGGASGSSTPVRLRHSARREPEIGQHGRAAARSYFRRGEYQTEASPVPALHAAGSSVSLAIGDAPDRSHRSRTAGMAVGPLQHGHLAEGLRAHVLRPIGCPAATVPPRRGHSASFPAAQLLSQRSRTWPWAKSAEPSRRRFDGKRLAPHRSYPLRRPRGFLV